MRHPLFLVAHFKERTPLISFPYIAYFLVVSKQLVTSRMKHCRLGRWMVGRCMDEIEHIKDSNTGQGTQKSKDHLGKYQTSGMYPKVVVRACNNNFAQHLLSYPPSMNGAKRNLGRLRCSCQRAPEQGINNQWIYGILKL